VTLTISKNRLRTIHSAAFASTLELRHLYLDHNDIDLLQPLWGTSIQSQLNSPFNFMTNLETLNLRNNSIIFVYGDWVTVMTKLRELDLSYNNISSLRYEDLQFISGNRLHVNLTHNKIRNISLLKDYGVQARNPVHIDVNDNPLDCSCTLLWFVQLVKGVHRPQYAKNLILQADRLNCSMPNNLKDTPVRLLDPKLLLCPLDQTNDPRQRKCPLGCECMVRTYDNALVIKSNSGNLTHVPRLPELPQNLHIMELHLENNTLLRLPSSKTPGYANVTSLHLTGNNLTHLDVEQLPSNLTHLDVSWNHLQSLNASVLGFLNRTMKWRSMKLSGNPWMCDCDAKPLLLFTQDNFERIGDRNEMMCMDAEIPTRMVELSTNDICPGEKGVYIALDDYRQLPGKVRIGEVDRVQMRRCMLPGHAPVASILDYLGIVSPKTLIFESDNLGMNITRQHLDHLHSLKRFRFTTRRLTHVPANLLTNMRNLSHLELCANIEEMPSHMFDGLENLEFIEFGGNKLRQMPRGIFSKMPKLKHLNLWSNELHNLTKHDFEGATSVVGIDIHGNGIEQLPHDVFTYLTNLTDINLSANVFRSLPEGLFEHNKHLVEVRLMNNRVKLDTLPSRLFANQPELKILRLRADLETLPGDLFEHSTQITNISLEDNLLSTLPANLLEHQVNLLSLDLSNNKLTHLPDSLFENTINLEELRLENNFLTDISR